MFNKLCLEGNCNGCLDYVQWQCVTFFVLKGGGCSYKAQVIETEDGTGFCLCSNVQTKINKSNCNLSDFIL